MADAIWELTPGIPPVGRRFVKGPIPLEWLAVACSVGGKAANVAWAIWYRRGTTKRTTDLPITRRLLRHFSVHPETAVRILEGFSRRGLLTLLKRRGRSPRVSILRLKEDEHRARR